MVPIRDREPSPETCPDYAISEHPMRGAPRLLTAAEVAALLGVPKTWVYEQSRLGRVPTVTLGRYKRYRRSAIEEWVGQLEAPAVIRRVLVRPELVVSCRDLCTPMAPLSSGDEGYVSPVIRGGLGNDFRLLTRGHAARRSGLARPCEYPGMQDPEPLLQLLPQHPGWRSAGIACRVSP